MINLGIDCLIHETTGSPVHQLALVTAIRQLFTRNELVPAAETLRKTRILLILTHILNFQSADPEFYFMKLESLWILINMSMCDTEEIRLIFTSEISTDYTTELPIFDEEAAQREFERNKSQVLAKLESMLSECLQETQ